MTSSLTKFNNSIDNLCLGLIKFFPGQRDIKLYREKISWARSVNPQLILQYFLKHVYPFKSQIMERNEQFFLDDNYIKDKIINNDNLKNDIKNGGDVDDEYILMKAVNFKKLYENSTPQQKDFIWNSFRACILFCEEYVRTALKL